MISSRPALTLLALLSLAAAACGSGTAPTQAPGATAAPGGATQRPAGVTQAPVGTTNPVPGTSDLPCAAMEADVTAARGQALQKKEYIAGQCNYTFGSNAQAPLGGAILVRRERENSTDLSAMKLAFPEGEDVSGLGDAAYWAESPSVMYAAFKNNVYAVQLVLFDQENTPDQLKTMAGTVMEALLSRL